jgi:hypothetical protein
MWNYRILLWNIRDISSSLLEENFRNKSNNKELEVEVLSIDEMPFG